MSLGALVPLAFKADADGDREKSELTQAYSNARYGFVVPYPANWREAESENADGVTLTSPDDKASIVAYGSPIADGEAALPDQGLQQLRQEGALNIESRPIQIDSEWEENGQLHARQVDGWLFTFTIPNGDGEAPEIAMLETVVDNGRQVTVRTSAAADHYSEYRELFEAVIAEAAIREECMSCTTD